MYAIVAHGNQQYKVEPDQVLEVDFFEAEPGSEFAFDRVEVSTNRFEHLNQIETGFRGGVGQARQSDHIGAGGVNARTLANSCGC